MGVAQHPCVSLRGDIRLINPKGGPPALNVLAQKMGEHAGIQIEAQSQPTPRSPLSPCSSATGMCRPACSTLKDVGPEATLRLAVDRLNAVRREIAKSSWGRRFRLPGPFSGEQPQFDYAR